MTDEYFDSGLAGVVPIQTSLDHVETVKMSNVFGFSTETKAGGDFIPIIKYNAQGGRIFRIDRTQTADGFASEPVDITQNFKAVADFENIETGWMLFAANTPPSFALVRIGQMQPPKPSEQHKNGVRFMLKLTKACGGDQQVREIAGQAKTFVAGIEQVYLEYKSQKDAHPDMLPVLILTGTSPVTTSTGSKKTTNFRPNFKIVDWVKRPDDLIHIPVPSAAPQQAQAATNGSGVAPSTGSQPVPPPAATLPVQNLDDDFG